MKQLIILLICFGFMNANGQERDKRVRITPSLLYSINMGSSSYKSSDKYITGQLQNGVGMELVVTKSVYHALTTGMYVGFSTQHLNESAVVTQLRAHYNTPNYFTTVNFGRSDIKVLRVGIEVSADVPIGKWGIDPFARLGIASVSGYDGVHTKAHLKKKNDNYFEDREIRFNFGPADLAFSPAVGFRVSRKIGSHLNLNAGMQYTGFRTEIRYTEKVTNLYGEKTDYDFKTTQRYSSCIVTAALQIRIGRNRGR